MYKHPEAPDPERLSAAAAEAQARLIEDTEEWEIADEEGGDGGSAVKLLPAAKMAQARDFQQGLNRAVKAEEKFNRDYERTDARSTWRDHRSGKGTNGYDKDSSSMKPSVQRKGEIKYHAANEKKMRKKAARDLDDDDDDDDWGFIGEDDGKAVGQDGGADEQNGNPTDHDGNNATSQRNRDPGYIPPHKRAVHNRILKEPKHKGKDKDTEEDLIMLQGRPKETPPPPQHLMARLRLLEVDGDADDGGVSLI